jgi:hypothetical protein
MEYYVSFGSPNIRELNLVSPTVMKIRLASRSVAFGLQITCPQCHAVGFESLLWSLNFFQRIPLCWLDTCYRCHQTFYTHNGHSDTCTRCGKKLSCLEMGSALAKVITLEERPY